MYNNISYTTSSGSIHTFHLYVLHYTNSVAVFMYVLLCQMLPSYHDIWLRGIQLLSSNSSSSFEWWSLNAAYMCLHCTSKAGVRFFCKPKEDHYRDVCARKQTIFRKPHSSQSGCGLRVVWAGETIAAQPKGRISVRLTCWNHRWLSNRLSYLAASMEGGISCSCKIHVYPKILCRLIQKCNWS